MVPKSNEANAVVTVVDGTSEFLNKWKRRLHVNRKLLPLKVLLFIMSTGGHILFPYYVIHMLSIGLTLTESGIIYALIPVVGLFGQPLAGFLADKLGDSRKVAITFIMLGAVFNGLLCFTIPKYSKTVIKTPHDITGQSFRFVCTKNVADQTVGLTLLLPPTYKFPQADKCSLVVQSQFQQFNPNTDDTARCYESCEESSMILNRTTFDNSTSFWTLPNLKSPTKNDTSWSLENPWNVVALNPEKNGDSHFSTCPFEACVISCQLLPLNVSVVCHKDLVVGSHLLTFILYTAFRVLGAMAGASGMMLITSAAVQMVKKEQADYGFHQAFNVLGGIVSPPFGGYLVGVASAAKGQQDYSPIFIVFIALWTLGAILMWFMDFQLKPPAKKIWTNIGILIKNPRISAYVTVMFLIGAFYGILENYLFWYMQTFLASPKWLLGMTSTVSAVSALPVVFASTWIIKLCGHTKIFMVSFLLYGVRFLAYSFIYDPYLILPVEILEAFTFSLTWVVATIYNSKVAPVYVATLQGLTSALHYSVGRGVGSIIAGTLFDNFPPRLVYRMVAATAIGCGVVYAVLHYTWLRRAHNPKVDTATLPVSDEALVDNVRRQSIIGEFFVADLVESSEQLQPSEQEPPEQSTLLRRKV
ncbi:putative Major facilitator superfamily domain-containing protein 6 [Hypsibius exemplaris]|uniref:Major facilitator superfamily domain-containing protein 6 n=1 Tax=Hypsibius exemplaris TaxID=2072580 RepID=A0A1W0X8J4_HYPEX|nr:putative Major facilitator superfamily domain-containing protein 6 [Hypsibius exemplaris]